MEKVMKYLVQPFYSDLALGYYMSGPEPTINTKWCPANSLDDFDNLWMAQGLVLIFESTGYMTDEWGRVKMRLCMNCIKFLILQKIMKLHVHLYVYSYHENLKIPWEMYDCIIDLKT